MAYPALWQDNLPWSDNENDRKLVAYVLISLVICTLFFVIVQFLPKQEVKEQRLEDVSPRLAKLIIKRQQQPEPPPPLPKAKKAEKPKPKPKPEPKKAEKPTPRKPEPRKTPSPKPDRTAVARRQAQQHITEIQDALADLRDLDVASSIEHNKPVHNSGAHGSQAKSTTNTTAVIAARASKGSGGINTSSLSRATGDSRLQGRQTTAVTSNLGSGGAKRGSRSGGSGAPSRPYEEIELVFQKNKGSIFSLYSRALRRDPTLQGKVVLELTISPAGRVTQVRIVSSEIKNARLLEQLKARVKLFRFQSRNVDTLIVKYPIDFLPT